MRTVAQGDALTALNKVIDAYRATLESAHAAENKMGLDKAIQDSRDRISEYQGATSDLRNTPFDRARDAANRAANVEADGAGYGDADRHALVQERDQEAQQKYFADRAKWSHDTVESQQDAIELAQREAELAGASDAYRTSELDKLKLQQQIRRTFPDMAQGDVAQLVAGVAAVDATNDKAKLLQDTWSEIRSAGDQFLEDLTNPDGSGLKSLLKDVEQEFIKLAALNPIKNLLLGEKNTTLGGLFGSLFGGSKASIPDGFPSIEGFNAPHNASGTQDWSGGRTWLNENGGEIADLPSGTRIYPAAETRRMLAAANENGGGGAARVDIRLNTELFTATVSQIGDQRVAAAAPQIGNGAADLASQRGYDRQRRRMR